MERVKTHTNDPIVGMPIYHYTDDIFKIYLRKGNNKKTTFQTLYSSMQLVDFLTTYHSLSIPKGQKKYLVRVSKDQSQEIIYSFKGLFLSTSVLVKSKEPQTQRKAPTDMRRCNLVVRALPEKILTEVETYSYNSPLLPKTNKRDYIFKILVAYFFSLNDSDKEAFIKKAKDRYEDSLKEVFNDALELL